MVVKKQHADHAAGAPHARGVPRAPDRFTTEAQRARREEEREQEWFVAIQTLKRGYAEGKGETKAVRV